MKQSYSFGRSLPQVSAQCGPQILQHIPLMPLSRPRGTLHRALNLLLLPTPVVIHRRVVGLALLALANLLDYLLAWQHRALAGHPVP